MPNCQNEPTFLPSGRLADIEERMRLLSQVGESLRVVFTFPRLLDRRGWWLFGLYVFTALVAVGLFAALALWITPVLRDAVLSFFLPENFRLVGRLLLNFFGRVSKLALMNFILVGGMALLSILCAPVKEVLSRHLEKSQGLCQEAMQPWPLWREVIEEIKYLLLYVFIFNAIFWLGYPPWWPLRVAATALSYLALFAFAWADYLSPFYFRHGLGYLRIFRLFFARPAAGVVFSAIWCLPAMLSGMFLRGDRLVLAFVVLTAVQVLVIAPAVASGTVLSARLYPQARALSPLPRLIKWTGVSVLMVIAVVGAFLTASLSGSLLGKTQILKCGFRLVPGTFSFSHPTLVDPSLGLQAELEIENPTALDVLVEDSRLEVKNSGQMVGNIRIARIFAPARSSVRQKVALRLSLSLGKISKIKELFVGEWEFVLWLRLSERWEFPVFFR